MTVFLAAPGELLRSTPGLLCWRSGLTFKIYGHRSCSLYVTDVSLIHKTPSKASIDMKLVTELKTHLMICVISHNTVSFVDRKCHGICTISRQSMGPNSFLMAYGAPISLSVLSSIYNVPITTTVRT